MTSHITQKLHAGWIEKLECDRVAEVKNRANIPGQCYCVSMGAA